MRYRPEIDGLRAVAISLVILFHAGSSFFSGGFVGVDVFFVVSGYLITTIIFSKLESGNFSLLEFYERRARRILPALFVVMAACSFIAYFWMLPDELENFGQSLVATSFFSNNILLLMTSGYWALTSEFKPLLHTWSLSVEEQYYIVFPLLLMLGWRYFRKYMVGMLAAALAISILGAHWASVNKPVGAFYLLPTRAWELLLGSFAAIYAGKLVTIRSGSADGLLSGLGLALIAGAALYFDSRTPIPGFHTLIPTVGALLVVLFAKQGTLTSRALSSPAAVGVGRISYSAYLWHFPLIAFARIYLVEPVGLAASLLLCGLALFVSYFSWKYIEMPFRAEGVVSRRFIFTSSLLASLLFVGFGFYLHNSHGVPGRMYSGDGADGRDLHIAYNERVFEYRKDEFSNPRLLNILVIGNSFARDFVNMTLENFDLDGIEIAYRDDFGNCLASLNSPAAKALLNGADIIVLASGGAGKCVGENIELFNTQGKRLFYIGTKQFGYNLNWIARIKSEERANLSNPLRPGIIALEERVSAVIPAENYISLLKPIVKENRVPVTDEQGRLISPDRFHLTKYGAIYLGQKALVNSAYGEILKSAKERRAAAAP
ncbi:MAG: acyltransferase family protein [Actinomycetota bacterium]